MTVLPGHTADGAFEFTDQDGQVYQRPVTRAAFNLFCPVPTWPEGALAMDIKIMVEPLEVPSSGRAPMRIDLGLDTHWLTISGSDVKTKARDMLDCPTRDFKYDGD